MAVIVQVQMESSGRIAEIWALSWVQVPLMRKLELSNWILGREVIGP
jgi:hypothetical protein